MSRAVAAGLITATTNPEIHAVGTLTTAVSFVVIARSRCCSSGGPQGAGA